MDTCISYHEAQEFGRKQEHERERMPRCPNPRCQIDYPAGAVQCVNPFCQCLLPEAVIAGRYRIETLIGMGGMGAVYRVSDTFEVEQVALKVLSLVNVTSEKESETAAERFRREARYAHQLQHKNIVPVLNFGQDGTLLYLAMPLITGSTVKDLLKAQRPLPTLQAQQYVHDLAAAIDAIHAHPQQIIHRDIKPSNLLIHQDDGRLMVADFGIARALQNEKALTQRGWSLGTEHYIAPEQEQGKAEPASDLYAMGVVTYQMFTGMLPFQAVVKSKATELPGPSTLNLALPQAVDAVILRAIEVEPAKRYASAQAFADALDNALAKDNASAPTISATAFAPGNAHVLVRTLTPENCCIFCGRENRSTSRFCRYCGHSLDETSPVVSDVCIAGYLSEQSKQGEVEDDVLLIAQGLCVTLVPPVHPFGLFALADTIPTPQSKIPGGHIPSRLAIETLADALLPLLTTPSRVPSPSGSQRGNKQSTPQIPTIAPAVVEQWVRDALRQANQVIYHCNADYETNMGSTLTVALLHNRHLILANVGANRAYYYSTGKRLRCLTRDHTLTDTLVDAGLLTREEVGESAKRHQYYRYLGKAHHVTVDLVATDVEAGDFVLLCSDGLWSTVSDEHIARVLSQGGEPQKLATTLVSAANSGADNASAIVIAVQ